jgi:hypothetical protein
VVLEAINFAGENTAFDMDFGGFSDAMLPSFKNIDVDDGIFRPHMRARDGLLVFSWQNCGAKTRRAQRADANHYRGNESPQLRTA